MKPSGLLFTVTLVIVTAFVTTTVRGDLSEFNDGFVSYLRQVLQHLQDNMEQGIPELQIPPLDPLKLDDKISVDVKEAGNIQINGLTVRGLKSADIKDIQADLNKPSASFDLVVGHIQSEGTYIANLVFAKIFPVKGSGALHINLTDVKLSGQVVLHTEDFSRFECKDVEFSLKFGEAKINFENILDPKLAPTINKILSGFSPLIANVVLPKIQHSFTPAIVKAINKQLTKLNIADLIEKATNGL